MKNTNPLNSSEQKKEFGRKPEVNEAARIVNSHFLQSPYDGKDWESVRKDIIEELTTYIAKHTQEARIDTVKALAEELNFTKGDYGHDEILDFLARLENGEAVTVAQLEQQERTLKPKTGGK